jgi:hypothetical protein
MISDSQFIIIDISFEINCYRTEMLERRKELKIFLINAYEENKYLDLLLLI